MAFMLVRYFILLTQRLRVNGCSNINSRAKLGYGSEVAHKAIF